MTMMHDLGSSSDEHNARILKRKGDKDQLGKPLKKSKHCRASKAKWTPEEDEILTRAVLISGEGNWKKIAQSLNDRSHLQCLHRWQKVLNPALVKGPWKEEEDAKLTELVEKYGPKDWSTIAGHIPGRIGKQCRERWFNHLSPDVRKTNWTPEEDKIIIDAHSKVGNKWTNISKMLDGRPANAIKNHWNSTLLKRIQDSNGEPTIRRDRNRNKKPAPMRATEFDFRTQMLHPQQHFDESSDCSPHNYQQHSPLSSPEHYHHQHEAPQQQQQQQMANTVRFHLPDAPHVFFTPFNNMEHAAVNNIQAMPIWDSWAAPNVIHINPSIPTSQPVHNVMNFAHNIQGAQMVNPLAGNIAFNAQNVINAMNTVYDTEYALPMSEAATPEDLIDIYAPSSAQGSPLPAEMQYCFDAQQSHGSSNPAHYEGANMHNLTHHNVVDSSGMNINQHLSGINMSSLLGLDALPPFCEI